ncbi:MAG: hypothetical protein RL329_449 [Bacteroidota bacterium]
MKTYTLYELNEFLRRVVAMNFPDSVWVTAETVQVSWSRGHCYLDLVEKNADSTEIEAKMLAILWANDLKRICRTRAAEVEEVKQEDTIQSEIKNLLKAGLNIRVKVRADFSELYGVKLVIEDFDFTQIVGNQALERINTIQHLQKTAAMSRNKKLKPPVSWQRIAVISSETAAGWQDFQTHLTQNRSQFQFELKLFSAAMQGIHLQNEMMNQLNAIEARKDAFDAIVIVRGGGSRMDLAGFDSRRLCELAAQSSLPILTGIGHEIDESILDMIAFRAFKTPTAVADFLIEQQTANDRALIQLRQQTQHIVYQRIEQSLTWLQAQKTRTQWIGHHYLAQQTQQLNHLAMMVQSRHPKTLAAQGYVFIEKNNKRLIDSTSIDCNDIIQIYFPDGVINAAVLDKKII